MKTMALARWLQWAATPTVKDEELRRRGFLVVIVSAALALLALVLGINSLLIDQSSVATAITLLSAATGIACAAMARSGIARPAAYLVTWFPCLGILAVLVTNPSPTAVFFLSIPLLLASIVLSSLQILPVLLLGLGVALFGASRGGGIETGGYLPALFFVAMIGALAYLGAWSVERALRRAHDAGRAIEQANEALHGANSDLESRVARRTADLQQALTDLQQRETELHRTLDELRSSQETIRELSAPILPVAPGVLVAPLVGAIDGERAAVLMSGLLGAAERDGARYLILDVTGIPLIDTQVARVLLQATQAVRLLGAQVILTGIRPEVAQTLVGLGVDLGGIVTRASLQSGIAEARSRLSASGRAQAV